MESKRGVDHTDSIRFPSLAADRQGPVIGGFERVPSPIPQFLPVFLRSPPNLFPPKPLPHSPSLAVSSNRMSLLTRQSASGSFFVLAFAPSAPFKAKLRNEPTGEQRLSLQ